MCKSTTMVLLLSCTAGSALAQDENEHHYHQGCDGQMRHGMVVPEFRNYLTHAHDDPRDQVEEMGLAW